MSILLDAPTQKTTELSAADALTATLREVLQDGCAYGHSAHGAGRSVLVEFVSAHPNAPLSAAHARGGVVGDILAALQSAVGFAVQREFYANDADDARPMRAFGRAVLARYRQRVAVGAEGDLPPATANPHDYGSETVAEFIGEIADKIYDAEGDRYVAAEDTTAGTEADFTRLALRVSQDDQREALDAFGIRFDHWTRESDLTVSGEVAATVDALTVAGYAHKEKGALWLRSTRLGDTADRALLRADGAASYLAADLAYHRAKFERGFAHLIDVWSADHAGYIVRTRAGLEALGFDPECLTVVLCQSVRILKNGTAIRGSGGTAAGSASAASAITLRELIGAVGADSARFQLALRPPGEPIDLDLDAADRDDSPLRCVQTAQSRATHRAGEPIPDPNDDALDAVLLTHENERALMGVIAELPAIIAEAAQTLAPQRIPAYATRLGQAIMAADKDLGHSRSGEATKTRAALFAAAAIALENALILIGIPSRADRSINHLDETDALPDVSDRSDISDILGSANRADARDFMNLFTSFRPRILTLAALGAFGVIVSSFGAPPPARAGSVLGSFGDFRDAAGVKHSWRINATHTLIWDEKPFVPVGGQFQVSFWKPGATEEDWQSDQRALGLLKAHGLTDVYLQPPHGVGLTEVNPAAIQRMIDELDKDGFTYGISIDDGPRAPLEGYVVQPGVYRQVVPEGASSVSFATAGVDSYLYYITNGQGNERGQDVILAGEGTPSDGTAVIPMQPLPGTYIASLIPRKRFLTTGDGSPVGYPNFWEGFDDYRDSLLGLFRGIHLGAGFRFFADPLPTDLTLSGVEGERLVPTGIGFQTEWSVYLGKRYKTLSDLEQAWGILERDTKTIGQAARFVPLWSADRGIWAFYDRTTGQRIAVDTQRSSFWRDLTAFKTVSIQRYMNDLATVLKRAVADVPVVYRASGSSPLLYNLPPEGGFDGIGIAAYGHGESLVTQSAGQGYAYALESPRAMWLPVLATADALPADKATVGYSSPVSMHRDLDYLREIGARGFYVDSLHVTDPAHSRFDLSARPEQLDWLSRYQKLLVATGVSAADVPLPTAVLYPRGMQGATLRPLPKGYMLPTDRPSVTYDFGSICHAYALSDPNAGVVYYLFRPNGVSREIKLHIPKSSLVEGPQRVAWYPASAGRLEKNTLTLTVGADPVRIQNLASLPVPADTFDELTNQAARLILLMKQRNIIDEARFREELSLAKRLYNKDQPYNSILQVEEMLRQMRSIVQPFAWYEAESDRKHTFDEGPDLVGASGGRVLRVGMRTAGAPAAVATFDVVGQGSAVEVWAATSPDASLTFRLDGQPLLDQATVPRRTGAPYADGRLVWTYFGMATVPRGVHKISVRASGPATLDVVLLTPPSMFVPDGTNMPPIIP